MRSNRCRASIWGGFDVGFAPGNHNGSKFVELSIIGAGGRFMH